MQYVNFGTTGLQISRLGFGGIPIQRIDQPGTRELLIAAHKAGINYIDTARAYTVSEAWIGQSLEEAGLRDDFILATKCRALTKADMEAEIATSLKNLRTDHIDLLYQHRVDPKVPMEDVAGTVKDLIREGKVLHFGLSEASAASIRRAHAVQPVSAVQSEYSLLWREPETKIFPTLRELGIGLVPYCPLGRGFLTGAIDENSRFTTGRLSTLPQFTPEALKHNMPLPHLIRAWAERKQCTMSQFAIAWLLAQAPWIAPIPGTTDPAHLDDFLGGATVRLTPAELEEFGREYAKITLMGHRADAFTESQIDK